FCVLERYPVFRLNEFRISGEEKKDFCRSTKKFWIVVIRGILHEKQNSRLTKPVIATKRKEKLFSGFFTVRP
ncbi:hypothetical protein, partial [Enterobacter roggenkampii]|uniref:hypothetical protein n=1 Tax=Enterobacter roggenkampii TaxID=1812935 RepID=UPI002F3602BA